MKTFLRRSLALALAASALTLTPIATPPALAAPTYSGSLTAAIKTLPVSSAQPSGYDRDLFKHWVDANGDCQDARQEVLIAEATAKVTASCTVSKGKWVSYYDRGVTTNPSTFDIDHMVPLSEAWKSGANSWDAATRERFANDLGDKRSLVAVTATSNRSKGDKDPALWMPRYGKCRYVTEWTAVKLRWSLKIDAAEKRKLLAVAKTCGKVTVKVTKASIKKAPTTASSSTGLRVTSIAYDPAGADTLNGEFVTLKNTTAATITVGGWTLKDSVGTSYTFPSLSLPAGATMKLHTGSGSNSTSTLYAGKGTAWWNNGGDSFTLSNSSGAVQQTGSYSGQGDGSTANF